MCPAGPNCRVPYCTYVHATSQPASSRGDGGGAPGAPPLPRLLTGLDQPWPPAGGSVAPTGALGAPPDLLMHQETGPMTMTPGTPRGDGRVGAPPNPRLRPDAPPTSDAESSDDSPTVHLFSSEYSYTEPTPDGDQ